VNSPRFERRCASSSLANSQRITPKNFRSASCYSFFRMQAWTVVRHYRAIRQDNPSVSERRLRSGAAHPVLRHRQAFESPHEYEAEARAKRLRSGPRPEAGRHFGVEKWAADQRHSTPLKDTQGFDGAAQALPRQITIPLSPCPSDGYKVEAAGIEPASRNVSTPASTCVAEILVLALAAPFGRVRFKPARNFFNLGRAQQ